MATIKERLLALESKQPPHLMSEVEAEVRLCYGKLKLLNGLVDPCMDEMRVFIAEHDPKGLYLKPLTLKQVRTMYGNDYEVEDARAKILGYHSQSKKQYF